MTVTQKAISEWTAVTTLAAADNIPVVIDVATTPKSRRITLANLLASLVSPIVVTIANANPFTVTSTVTGNAIAGFVNGGTSTSSRFIIAVGENLTTKNGIVCYWNDNAISGVGAVRPAMLEIIANSGATGGINVIAAHASGVITFATGGTTERVRIAEDGTLSTYSIVPQTNDTYYLGKNDDDTPLAWKGVILKDTTNGKYYRIEVTNGAVVATDLTD